MIHYRQELIWAIEKLEAPLLQPGLLVTREDLVAITQSLRLVLGALDAQSERLPDMGRPNEFRQKRADKHKDCRYISTVTISSAFDQAIG